MTELLRDDRIDAGVLRHLKQMESKEDLEVHIGAVQIHAVSGPSFEVIADRVRANGVSVLYSASNDRTKRTYRIERLLIIGSRPLVIWLLDELAILEEELTKNPHTA